MEARSVVKRFAGHTALDGVSVEVRPGRVFGLLGPNGAGKTTLIRIINRITMPDEGEVMMGGRLMDAVSKTCGGLAAVFAGEEGHYAYALGRADGQDISPLVKAMNTALHGRGGGRNSFAQGSVETERSAIESFFKENGYGICN